MPLTLRIACVIRDAASKVYCAAYPWLPEVSEFATMRPDWERTTCSATDARGTPHVLRNAHLIAKGAPDRERCKPVNDDFGLPERSASRAWR